MGPCSGSMSLASAIPSVLGHQLGLFLDILFLSCVMEILQLCICRSSTFTCSSNSQRPTYSSVSGPGWQLGQTAFLFSFIDTIRADSTALPQLVSPLQQAARNMGVRGGHVSCSHAFRTFSPVPSPPGQAMSKVPVAIEGNADTQDLGLFLRLFWCLRAMQLLDPYLYLSGLCC